MLCSKYFSEDLLAFQILRRVRTISPPLVTRMVVPTHDDQLPIVGTIYG